MYFASMTTCVIFITLGNFLELNGKCFWLMRLDMSNNRKAKHNDGFIMLSINTVNLKLEYISLPILFILYSSYIFFLLQRQ